MLFTMATFPLLTHTHGLKIADGKLVSEYKPGESWAYRGPSIDLLTTIIKKNNGTVRC